MKISTIINIYAPKPGAPNFINTILKDFKAQINPSTLIVGNFDTLLSPLGRSTGQRINRGTSELNNMIHQMDLTDIY